MNVGRALIIDTRAVVGVEVCRSLARLGWKTDVFAQSGSPAFRSRFCDGRITLAGDINEPDFIERLEAELASHEMAFNCSEEILERVAPLSSQPAFRHLPLPPPESLEIVTSKNKTLALAVANGVAIPRTIIPGGESELAQAASELGFPLVIKGEKGEATRNVRFVETPGALFPMYRSVMEVERAYAGRPSLQEYISGPQYSIGGLFHRGTPLRICAYRKLFTYPRRGGLTAKAITERPARLLESALTLFKALEYTGLGQMQFMRDRRDGEFKLLEINPRVWASIGLAQHAGVDLYTPYSELAQGRAPAADLRFKEGVAYHRFSVEMRLLTIQPLQVFRFLRDCVDPRVKSDFEWQDLGPHLTAINRAVDMFRPHDSLRWRASK